jgi:hypothetical protein
MRYRNQKLCVETRYLYTERWTSLMLHVLRPAIFKYGRYFSLVSFRFFSKFGMFSYQHFTNDKLFLEICLTRQPTEVVGGKIYT